jgi:hypothetical protein
MKITAIIGSGLKQTVSYRLIDNVPRVRFFSAKCSRDDIIAALSSEEQQLYGNATGKVIIRTRPLLQRNAVLKSFAEGCRVAGFIPVEVPLESNCSCPPGLATVIWGLHAGADEVLSECRNRGENVIVVDLAMTGLLRPDYYQVCLNGLNQLPKNGDPERAAKLGLKVGTRRKARKDAPFLILEQYPGDKQHNLADPAAWGQVVYDELKRLTNRPVIRRPHPKITRNSTPLADDLAKAFCVITYNSTAAVEAFTSGVPVICDPSASYADCAIPLPLTTTINKITFRTKKIQNYLNRLAVANFTLDEIRSGLPQQQLIGDHNHD